MPMHCPLTLAAARRREEHDQRRDVVGGAEPQPAQTRRDRLAALRGLDVFGESGNRREHARHRDGHDRVDRDVRAGALQRPRPREGRDAGLGRRIVGLAEVAALAGDRRHQDDPPALALRAHVRDRRARAGEGAVQVRLDRRDRNRRRTCSTARGRAGCRRWRTGCRGGRTLSTARAARADRAASGVPTGDDLGDGLAARRTDGVDRGLARSLHRHR